MSSDPTLSKESQAYQSCAGITLDHQVGSRYFLSAANACKIVFLKNGAVHFLVYIGRDTGNKLERDLHAKLLDPTEIAADAFMFYHDCVCRHSNVIQIK